MRRLPTILAASILVLAWSGLPLAGDSTAGATEKEQFLAQIRAALEQQDREAISRLSYWGGVDARQRQLQEERQESMFDHPLLQVELRPRPAGYRAEFVNRGTQYRFNLPIEGLVRIEFVGQIGAQQTRLLPYGMHGGRYYIARVTEVGPADAAKREKQLFIGVMIPSGPAVVDYKVSCSYDVDGEEVRDKFEGKVATQKVVWGHKINWCRVWNRSGEAWVRLVLKEKGETLYESEEIEPGRSAVYP